VIILVKHVDWS